MKFYKLNKRCRCGLGRQEWSHNKGWWGPRCWRSRSLFITGLAGLLKDSTHSARKKQVYRNGKRELPSMGVKEIRNSIWYMLNLRWILYKITLCMYILLSCVLLGWISLKNNEFQYLYGICSSYNLLVTTSLGWSLNRVKCHLHHQRISQLFICFSPTVFLCTGVYDHWILQSNSLALLSHKLWFLVVSPVPLLSLLFHVSLSNWKILLGGIIPLQQKGQVITPITVHITWSNRVSEPEKLKRVHCYGSVAGWSFLCFFH